MKVYSVFTQLLNQVTKFSKENDAATSTLKDLSQINDLEHRIITYYNNGYCTYSEYRILNDLCVQVKSTMREVIKVNNQVKALERDIRKNRLMYA